MATNGLSPAEDASDSPFYEVESPPIATFVSPSATLVTPALTLTAGGPGEVFVVVTSLTLGANYTATCSAGVGVPSVSYALYQSTTFTASHLIHGGTYTFTTTAQMSDGTSATSAPATITIN